MKGSGPLFPGVKQNPFLELTTAHIPQQMEAHAVVSCAEILIDLGISSSTSITDSEKG